MQTEALAALRRHLSAADHVDAGRCRFIGLDAVREAAGERWRDLRERVFIAARSIIERHVDRDDMIVQCANGFLTIYADKTEREAARRSVRIRAGLAEFFLGDPELSGLGVEAETKRLSVPDFEQVLAAERPDSRPPALHRPAAATRPTIAGLAAAFYEPVWDARAEGVAIFHALPLFEDGPPAWWRPAIFGDPGWAEECLQVTVSLIALAGRDLASLIGAGGRAAVMTPLPYAALASPKTRARLVQTLCDQPEAVRRLVWLRLEQAPLDAPAGQIGEACRTLLGRCGRLVIHAASQSQSFDRFDETGASLMGCTYPMNLPASAAGQDLARFAALARRARREVYVDGVDDAASAQTALASPARHIAGRAVGDPAPLRPAYRLTPEDVLARAVL